MADIVPVPTTNIVVDINSIPNQTTLLRRMANWLVALYAGGAIFATIMEIFGKPKTNQWYTSTANIVLWFVMWPIRIGMGAAAKSAIAEIRESKPGDLKHSDVYRRFQKLNCDSWWDSIVHPVDCAIKNSYLQGFGRLSDMDLGDKIQDAAHVRDNVLAGACSGGVV